ncbi:MAG: glycogen/starch/alpha-glucan phosphorylase [Verrucomicrobiales bacterium]
MNTEVQEKPAQQLSLRVRDVSPEEVARLKESILDHLNHELAHGPATATDRDWWAATCYAVRDTCMERFGRTQATYRAQNVRRVFYLSMEYLMGRLLDSNLWNTGLYGAARQALAELGRDLDAVVEEAPDMGLGNGGLGRLAACFMDSLATLEMPAVGYGIRYEFGLFRQEFVDNRQVERPDVWMRYGNPWQIVRPEYTTEIKIYGNVERRFNDVGECRDVWVNTKQIIGVPWDIPVVGYGCETVNFLRLWESRASEEFNFAVFNEGGYVEAVREKAEGETISKVLYPNDSTESGKELRLVQQYFFAACSIQDIVRRHRRYNDLESLPEKTAIQLNDTHPAVAILELMRVLVDEEEMEWEMAWDICHRTFSYTNHTLLPEALERWSVGLFEKVLPRHLQIAEKINRRFLGKVVEKKWPGDDAKKRVLSLFEEGDPQMLRMAHLSVVATHSTNGVAALHTRLLKENLFPEFNELYPDRFNNKTNGITPRRWLLACNPDLADLITEKIGSDWPRDLDQLTRLESFADDQEFQDCFMAIKHVNKERLAAVIKDLCKIEVSADAIFDVQIKRLHAYKRQHLNLLHILTLYRRLLHDPDYDMHPRVFVFSAKAAPGYELAKDIIYAINAVGEKINNDARIKDKLKVAFIPNYGVSIAEQIIPAADLSEQISTAGKEASGTGNMKLALNGALTIGTLDGANVEIRDRVGEENIFIFGHTVEEVEALWAEGYNPWERCDTNEELRTVLDWLASGYFTEGGRHSVGTICRSLLDAGDPFLVLADYAAYVECQGKVDAAFRDPRRWARMAVLNTARMGHFSSDRTIRQYAEEIWKLERVEVDAEIEA